MSAAIGAFGGAVKTLFNGSGAGVGVADTGAVCGSCNRPKSLKLAKVAWRAVGVKPVAKPGSMRSSMRGGAQESDIVFKLYSTNATQPLGIGRLRQEDDPDQGTKRHQRGEQQPPDATHGAAVQGELFLVRREEHVHAADQVKERQSDDQLDLQ